MRRNRPLVLNLLLLAVSLCAVGCGDRVRGSAMEGDSSQQRFRVITYNVLHGNGFPEDKSNPGGAGDAISDALLPYDADLITFSEGPSREVAERIAERMGMNLAYFGGRPTRWPGVVLSRFPIEKVTDIPVPVGTEDYDDLFTRHWGRALVQTPFGPLAVHSAHLYYKQDQVGIDVRKREIAIMLDVIHRDVARGMSVMLLGDLNSFSDSKEYSILASDGSLVDAYTDKGIGTPFTYSSTKPDRRIDYIWVGGALENLVTECRVLDAPPFAPDHLTGHALSDHLPVLADLAYPAQDSEASGE